MCINNFHIFAHDGTSTAVHLFSPYHPNQRPWKCCYPLGSFVPAASHPRVAPDACAGRLLMMEHEVKSIFNIERTFNSYLSDFVSHLTLPITFSIRIVADCVALSCQVARKLERATTLEFTSVPAIIFIHCYGVVLSVILLYFFQHSAYMDDYLQVML
jgi:hypothetical protein